MLAIARKIILLIFIGLGCAQGVGQIASDLRGRITDPSNAGVVGAQVVATDMNTGIARTVVSGADGSFVFAASSGAVPGCGDGAGVCATGSGRA